jgi:hypothetical protein
VAASTVAAGAVVVVAATGSARAVSRPRMRCLTMIFAASAMAGTLASAPIAVASPQCVMINPTTTQCETNGHSQITTSPPAMDNTSQWWPYSGFAIGFPW